MWFKAKTYGYGWYPCSWHGWLVTVLYVLLILFVFRTIDVSSRSVSDTLIGVILPFIILTIILIAICVKTGEKARWRWG